MRTAPTAEFFACAASLFLCLILAAPAQAGLTITREFIGGEEPEEGEKIVGGGDLQEIFNVAADAWEDVFASSEDNWEVTLKYGWADGFGSAWGQAFFEEQGGSNPVRITRSTIRFRTTPPAPGFFADPTPLDNSEFPIPLTTTDPDYPTLNTGRNFAADGGLAESRVDLLTIALHEIGHGLGLAEEYVGIQSLESPECQPGYLCVMEITAPRPYPGKSMLLTTGPHLSAYPFQPLMIPDPVFGLRQLISDLDILALQQIGAVLPARMTIEVDKVFTDGNTAGVQATLTCNDGYPRVQTETVSASQGVTFTVENFANGKLDCKIRASAVTGYQASYVSVEGVSDTECSFTNLVYSLHRICTITSTPEPVEVAVNKQWIIDGQSENNQDPSYRLDSGYRLDLYCNKRIIDGSQQDNGNWFKTLYDGSTNGTSDMSYSAGVVPDWQEEGQCWVAETVYDSAIEVSNECGDTQGTASLQVALASGDSCTISNTVFFVGIPVLSQTGMVIMAFLMLGMGYFSLRRFT